MTTIHLSTFIKAPIETVFDAARNIDLHIDSASKTRERAIKGRTTGLINLDEIVTWRAKHFGIFHTHTSKITEYQYPNSFTDEMIKGHFTSFKHQHFFYFDKAKNLTKMTDILTYQTPYGYCGILFDTWILKKYLTKFLYTRNSYLKKNIES